MLSPIDIQNKEFRKAKIGGYHMEEVNDFLDEILESYQVLTKENIELKDKIEMLNGNIQYYRSMEATIQNALVLAEKTAQDTKSLAYEKADQIKKDAYQKAEVIVEEAKNEVYQWNQQLDELKKQYQTIKLQIRQLLQGQLEYLEQQATTHSELTKNVELPHEEEVDEAEIVEEIEQLEDDIDEEAFYTKEFKIIGDEE